MNVSSHFSTMSKTPSFLVSYASTSSAVIEIPTASISETGHIFSINSTKTCDKSSLLLHIGRYAKSTSIFLISPSSKSITAKSVFAPPMSKPAIFINYILLISNDSPDFLNSTSPSKEMSISSMPIFPSISFIIESPMLMLAICFRPT